MHSSCNDGVIQLNPLSSYDVLEVVEIIHTCFVHLVLQYFPYSLASWILIRRIQKPAHSRGRMNSGVSLLAKTAFFNDVTITSSLRSVVQVLMGHITFFFSHTDCLDDSCRKVVYICQRYG